MIEFEQVLQECLHDVEVGSLSVEECLRRYPEHGAELEPVLLTSVYLAHGRDARVSEGFKRRVRTRLIEGMNAHPRNTVRSIFFFPRLAASLAVVILALLAAGTVYAQRALPGDVFYSWKLASENAWRSVSPDPVGTDLFLAERRADELIAVKENPLLYPQALNSYLETVTRLNSEINSTNEARILTTLNSQMQELNQSGVVIPQSTPEVLPVLEKPTQTPPATPTPTSLPTSTPIATITPPVILETPLANPTNLQPIVPTVQVPEVHPTLPRLVPTMEIPPLIP